jgi:branched-chain amino acid transport system permease protein
MDPQVLVHTITMGLIEGCMYSLFAIGFNLAFGVMRVVNVAHGQLFMLGCYAAYWLTLLYGFDPYFTLLFIIPLFFTLGVLLQKTFISKVIYSPMEVSLLVCFALGLVFENTALILWSGDFRLTRAGAYDKLISIGPINVALPRIIAVSVSISMFVFMMLLLNYTNFGRAIRAVMQDITGAKLVGIPINLVYLVSFGISISLAGASGGIMSLIYPFNPFIGYTYMLKAFCISVLGGFGRIEGSIVGGLILGVSESIVALCISSLLKDAVAFILMILILLLKPSGIFGR